LFHLKKTNSDTPCIRLRQKQILTYACGASPPRVHSQSPLSPSATRPCAPKWHNARALNNNWGLRYGTGKRAGHVLERLKLVTASLVPHLTQWTPIPSSLLVALMGYSRLAFLFHYFFSAITYY
jgi:hypothetical protein